MVVCTWNPALGRQRKMQDSRLKYSHLHGIILSRQPACLLGGFQARWENLYQKKKNDDTWDCPLTSISTHMCFISHIQEHTHTYICIHATQKRNEQNPTQCLVCDLDMSLLDYTLLIFFKIVFLFSVNSHPDIHRMNRIVQWVLVSIYCMMVSSAPTQDLYPWQSQE